MMDLPQLDNLMGAYYHEDFDMYDGSLWGPTAQYLVAATRQDARDLRAELDLVLDDLDEQAVEALLEGLGCYAYLGDKPGGYRGFLEELARRVDASLEG